MTDKINIKKKSNKSEIVILRGYRFSESTTTRRKGKTIKVTQAEFDYAVENGFAKGV